MTTSGSDLGRPRRSRRVGSSTPPPDLLVSGVDLTDDERYYLDYHRDRFTYGLRLTEELVARHETASAPVTVLEMGPHLFTRMLELHFGDRIRLQTAGHWYERVMSPPVEARHLVLDFNDLQYPDRWPEPEPADVALCFEVIEHLYTAPSFVVSFLHQSLKPGGHLAVSTPNAVALPKRLAMLAGRHPYEPLREDRALMGHVREYTEAELVHYLEVAGFAVERVDVNNYWPQHPVTRALGRLRRSLGQGFTAVGRR